MGSVGTSSFGSVVRRTCDLELPVGSSSSSSNVCMVMSLPSDFFYDWFEGRLDLDENLHLIDQSVEQSPRSDDDAMPLVLRVAQSAEQQNCEHVEDTFIILDSGSDVSLLPRSYIPDSSFGATHRLKDCQGNALGVSGTKRAEIVVHDLDETEAILRQEFLISDVTNCILSLGGLKKGWNIKRNSDEEILLVSPDGTLSIPTYYRGSSLAIDCQIRCIQEEPHHDLAELEDVSVRVVVKTRPEFLFF